MLRFVVSTPSRSVRNVGRRAVAAPPTHQRVSLLPATTTTTRRSVTAGRLFSTASSSSAVPSIPETDKSSSASLDLTIQQSNGGGDVTTTSVVDALQSAVEAAQPLVDPPMSSLGFGPTDTIIRIITSIHEYGGLPWWASILTMTVMVRSAILPLVIMSQKNTANLVRASPELEQFKADVRLNPPKSVEDQMKNSLRLKEIYTKYDISMKRTLAPLLVQMPLFITFFLGLRRLAETYPSMKEGGALWFTDLSAADPTYALPLIAAGTFLITIELGGEVSNPQMDAKMMKNVMRGLGIAMVPLTMTFESGVFVYWVTTNTFSVVQIASLKQPAVKKWLGLPDAIRPPPTAATMMKPPSFFEQLDNMTKPVNPVDAASPSTVTSTESKINEQFVSEMKEARSRRSRRRQH